MGVNDTGYFPGFLYCGIRTQLQNDALKKLLTKRHPYCLPYFNFQARGYSIAKSPALGYWRINTNLSIPHPTPHEVALF